MKNKHLLIVGGRDHTLDKVEKLGVRYSMLQIPELVNKRQFENAERYAVMDYENLDEVLSIARAWHYLDPFDAVVSFTEYGLMPASQCAIDLGIPGDNLNAVQVTRDKIKMRALLEQHALSPVRHQMCQTLADARAFLQKLGESSMVLKPFAGGLSEGVYFVHNESELEEKWRWTREATSGPILAEEFLQGPEFSVESISLHGKHEIVMVTEKLTTELPRFIELGHQAPARLDVQTHERIHQLVDDFLCVIDQQTSPAHTEIRLTSSGPKIIESQTRIGGDQIWEICQMVSGVDLMSETIATLVGLPLPQRKPVANAAAIRFFSYENVRVQKVSGISDAAQYPGVIRLICSLHEGVDIGTMVSSDSRQGYVLCTGSSPEEAVYRAEAARGAVIVNMVATSSVSS
ncbi:ATP-grasp domain-containing protein [Xenorhabdus bovienii]|uniref:ATP-grasp domain-containing protein n=1 Tax=Xenorhabdus bovienii TaxID=40576 RepID=UPI001EDD1B4D|nr:ATP-grasp domain-containing protein [Xenorhabdus bovienii]MCG3462479.1 ATP-grasp domain-containing protein [Xenorhabdus bovienii]